MEEAKKAAILIVDDHKKRAVDILQKRMDTIWTPKVKTEEATGKPHLVTIQNN